MAEGQIDLFPTNVLDKIAKGPYELAPADATTADRNRRDALGPLYDMLIAPSSLDQQLAAEAALSMVPAALLSSVSRRVVGEGYSLIDHIPEALRRPFEKNYGLLVDNALAVASRLTYPLVTQTLAGAGSLPTHASLDLQGYSQQEMACGETATATLLKAVAEPVSLADIDTQIAISGGSLLEDTELRRRGLSTISGFGSLDQLKTFIAAGYPVMVSVGWDNGGGHYVVVSGYDDRNGTLTIQNWDGAGNASLVPLSEFAPDWARHKNSLAVVLPMRDPRLESLFKASTDLRRPDQIYGGLTLSDFYVTPEGKVFVEAAYRHVSTTTDVTVRVNWNQSAESLDRQLGGSLAIRRRVADNWFVGITVQKMSIRTDGGEWRSFSTAPLAIYGTVETSGFQFRAGEEQGAIQASVAADLSKWVAGMGVKVNGSVDASGNYQVTGSLGWTF